MKAMMAEVAHEHFSMQTKVKKRKVRMSDPLVETMTALENASLDKSQKTSTSSNFSTNSKSSKDSYQTAANQSSESSLSSGSN